MSTYTAPPTCAEYMLSDAFFRLIAGPIGSGKTTASLMELLRRSMEQAPGRDGVRRTRWVICRTTLSQLKMTVLLDVLHWFRAIVTYKVTDQLLIFTFNDVYSEWYMIPLEDEEDQKRLLSMNLTGAYLNEAIETNPSLVPAIAGRCGRFPPPDDVGPTWFGIIADTNMPVEGSPWHKLMEDDRPPDWAVFIQPGGLDIKAENLTNLPGGRQYYERLARGNNEAWIDRYVNAKYGEDPSGTAVHRGSFRRSFHTVENIDPIHGYPLMVGQDFGRNPCSLICQPDYAGRLLVLEEIIAEDIGLERHVMTALKPALFKERYMGRSFCAIGDPSGKQRSSILEENNFDALKRMGVPAIEATTNDIDARLRAVDAMFLSQRNGGPAIIIDRTRCPTLVRALNGAYRFAKTKSGQSKSVPEKEHPWSDLADCLQYVCLMINASMVSYIARRIRPRTVRKKERMPVSGWT